MAKEKEIEVEYIAQGRYDVYDAESKSYVEFTPDEPKQKVSAKLAEHLKKQERRVGYDEKAKKAIMQPYFKIKGTVPNLNGSDEPNIEE